MKTKLIVLFFIWGLGCKENSGKAEPKIEKQEQESIAMPALPEIIKELAKFVEPTFSDSMSIDELMIFKELDTTGKVATIAMDRAVTLYKKMIGSKQTESLPIFEIKDTDMVILTIQGKGFGGTIWANVLVDRQTLEIKKVAFEHKAESHDYGAAMTQTSFENQFVGTKINLEQNTFGLQKAVGKAVVYGQIIDGISGSTVTSRGAVDMMNEGIKSYRNYLRVEDSTR